MLHTPRASQRTAAGRLKSGHVPWSTFNPLPLPATSTMAASRYVMHCLTHRNIGPPNRAKTLGRGLSIGIGQRYPKVCTLCSPSIFSRFLKHSSHSYFVSPLQREFVSTHFAVLPPCFAAMGSLWGAFTHPAALSFILPPLRPLHPPFVRFTHFGSLYRTSIHFTLFECNLIRFPALGPH